MATELQPDGTDFKMSLHGYVLAALTELYQKHHANASIVVAPARQCNAIAEKAVNKVGAFEVIMWTHRVALSKDNAKDNAKPDKDKDGNVDISAIGVIHPYGDFKFHATPTKYSEGKPSAVSPFWYVQRHEKTANMKLSYEDYQIGECTIKVPKFVNTKPIKKGDDIKHC